jgi:hypothetical protein
MFEPIYDRIDEFVTSNQERLRRHWVLALVLALVGAIPTGVALFFIQEYYYSGRIETQKTHIDLLGQQLQVSDARVAKLENQLKVPETKEKDVITKSNGILVTYYGYYFDEEAGVMAVETIALNFDKVQPAVVGQISGDVVSDGRVLQRSWVFDGYTRNDNLFFSYITQADNVTPTPSGIGIYRLRKIGSDYTGKATFLSCKEQKFYDCPFALTTEKLVDNEAARKKWPKLFSEKCTPLEMTPDSPTLIATNCHATLTPRWR